ncbi:MAG: sulfurtransferase-like selenium metabolism protein YedF [Clostridiaceae bacterium]|nr:sulfurtransferase-like selenium metabolism protein YedF [Clostridiaceae bacterium]
MTEAKDIFVIAIGSDAMGRGSDDLGRILMKSFIGALTELATPPDYILFVNAGVRLTTKGSNALEDLGDLEAKGTQLLSCGTCLNFFELGQPEKGSISNMMTILEVMASADKLINL